ncbi:unnamed protein product [Dovyalis caffra]|uniref:WAT1-related protein n=1 Tax=Dovyalis caffra TaxID=77055 RepID=A0AAV1SHC0_9ROSI|nr:unnamed protein product [Dovyalis caffra]
MKLLRALVALQCPIQGFTLDPFAYFFEKKERPPLTFSVLVQLFFLALLGITANQGFYLLGLYYASPTFASAMQNSVPAITFVMASALGLKKVSISRRDGLAKVVGTIASIGGASVITLYKGPPLLHQITQQEQGTPMEEDRSSKEIQNWTWGCIFLFGHCLSWAGCPDELKLISLQTWCIHKGGPVFVAIFQPMQTILVAIMASLFLGDQLYSGGIIGAILIMLGLYSVLWGKSEEKRVEIQNNEDTLTRNLLEDKNKDNGEERCCV